MPALALTLDTDHMHAPVLERAATSLVLPQLTHFFLHALVQVNLNTTATNCGACGTSCIGKPNSPSGVCAAGKCTLSCSAGFGNCDGQVNNGCEVRVWASSIVLTRSFFASACTHHKNPHWPCAAS
jgi:hypothetical protein